MAFVSIIVPVYGAERYVERCLRSVMAQAEAIIPSEGGDTTLRGSEEEKGRWPETDPEAWRDLGEEEGIRVECIIVDDGSMDGSMILVDRILAGYRGPIQFRVLRHATNLGLSAARNSGMAAADGDYLLFLDADDELMPGSIRLFAEAVKLHPGVDIVIGEYAHEGRYKEVSSRSVTFVLNQSSGSQFITSPDDAMRLFLHEGVLPDTAHNKLIRRALVAEHTLTFRLGILHEDNLWKWHLARHLHTVAFVNQPTMVYHDNPGTIVSTLTTRHLESLRAIIAEKLETMDSRCREEQLCNILHTLHQLEVRSRRLQWQPTGIYNFIQRLQKESGGLLFALSLTLLRVKMMFSLSCDSRLYRLLHRLALRLVR